MPFTCDKHGFILYGDSCLNCERERAPITPKITPPIPRKSPLCADNIRSDGADAMAMAITPRFSTRLLAQTAQPVDAKMEALIKKLSERFLQEMHKELEEAFNRALAVGHSTVRIEPNVGRYPFISMKVET